ncbi:glycosyltransferase [Denitrificimonas sp. JX-1]|uniref:Glycosyltransferase n=1 Tax=Denitrificimonas halotolerans TaxID=3098930 RepID=A0ABU5GQZ8_9GAMM|nr:glycosyltransferase [Denitrificimonas sp. JX-1]MDY7219412.1 glycosyltransferase [Denitrificimonas sp. JX-1]
MLNAQQKSLFLDIFKCFQKCREIISMSKSAILYITRNGMLEPLGQSQVLSYLRGLSSDYKITLISFEKPEDLADKTAVARVDADCKTHGIHWLPQRFMYKPKVIAPAWSMLVFLYLCLREVSRGNADIIHARSYLPTIVALVVNKLKGTPFIFDMRALWPEELITAGRIKRDSIMHKLLVRAERKCLARAATVVSLTHAAVVHLKKEYPQELQNQKISVISTCADLNRFVPISKRPNQPKVYSCLGTVLSGWFRLDWLAACFKVLAKREPDAQFEVITRDNPEIVRKAIGGDQDLQSRLKVYPLPSHEVHKAVQTQTASVMFFTDGLGKIGSAPTRMGEILGCGLPVIANAGIGDVAHIIERYRVGVLAKSSSDADMNQALDELEILMQDPELARRCRYAAEVVFSLENGIEAYRAVYQKILDAKSTKQRQVGK